MKFATFTGDDKMPLLGLGTWKAEEGEVYKAVREAIRIGYRHFDCAARYENEAEIGKALSDAMGDGDVKREELWITSKLWNNAHKHEHIQPALKQTLKDLQLDYLDLYLMHWPVALRPDVIFPAKGGDFLPISEVSLMETWSGLEECVQDGLAKHIGVSNFNVVKLTGILSNCTIKPEANQIELHPLLQQNELVRYCQDKGITVTAYSPLGSMDRPERLKKEDEPRLIDNPAIVSIAEEIHCTPAQVLINWALHRHTAVIPKSSNPKRLKENFEAQFVELSETHMNTIAGLNRGYRFIDGTIWTIEGSPYTLDWLWG